MLEEPPSIFPRGTGTRRPLRPRPAFSPGSAVYIQSTSGLSCMDAQAIGIAAASGGRPPASIRTTRHIGSSERRDAITAPAEPPPTITKSNVSDILLPPGHYYCSLRRRQGHDDGPANLFVPALSTRSQWPSRFRLGAF